MPIEVRQMVIKSTVIKEAQNENPRQPVPREDLEELRASIIAECKQVILDALRERRER